MDNKKDARGTGIFALKKNCTILNCNVYSIKHKRLFTLQYLKMIINQVFETFKNYNLMC